MAWTGGDSYQRLYVNGFEKANSSYATVTRYTSAALVVSGQNRTLRELLVYNFDMGGFDLERAAEDQVSVFQAFCAPGFYLNYSTMQCNGNAEKTIKKK